MARKLTGRPNGVRGPDKKPRKRPVGHPPPPHGTGRPRGAPNKLHPLGAKRASKTLHWRVPESAPADAQEAADEALGTILAVMRDKIKRRGSHRLKAAAIIREEICGSLTQRLNVNHQGTVKINVITRIAGDPGSKAGEKP